jgi:hypothetical protein
MVPVSFQALQTFETQVAKQKEPARDKPKIIKDNIFRIHNTLSINCCCCCSELQKGIISNRRNNSDSLQDITRRRSAFRIYVRQWKLYCSKAIGDIVIVVVVIIIIIEKVAAPV